MARPKGVGLKTHCKRGHVLPELADNGGRRRCIPCQRGYDKIGRERHSTLNKLHYAANKDYHRNKHLRNSFGITSVEYNRLLSKQNGLCAICGHPDLFDKGGKRLAVDHDHATGTVRGLLCAKCNMGIAFLRDSSQTALKAAAYLRLHAQLQLVVNEKENAA